jgi:hypothetical protein
VAWRESARASSSFPERLSGKLPGQLGGCSGLFQIPGASLVCPADSWNLEPFSVLSAGREAGPFPHPFPFEVPHMTDAEAVAQAQLDILVRVLEMFGDFLRRIDRGLPPSPQELSREDSEGCEPDITSEIHRTIQCALADHIDLLIAQLRAASLYKPVTVPPKSKKRVRRTKKDRSKKADRPRKRKA